MSTRRLCKLCGEFPKRPGHPTSCEECWLTRQPIQAQIHAAERRLALVPEALRPSRIPERHWPPGRRWCAGCCTFVRLVDARGSRCKACASRGAHASRLKGQYTVHGRPFTDVDYNQLFEMQGGRCYLCRRRTESRRFAVDHDHKTGEVRGLLCSDPEWGCNLRVVARFDADEDPLAMVERLRRYLSGDTPASRLPEC